MYTNVYLINFTTNVLLIDNAAIHHVHEVEYFFARTGVLLRYPPAYSPDLNPIEQAFASTKRFVRDNENVYLSTWSRLHKFPANYAKVIFITVDTFKCNTLFTITYVYIYSL